MVSKEIQGELGTCRGNVMTCEGELGKFGGKPSPPPVPPLTKTVQICKQWESPQNCTNLLKTQWTIKKMNGKGREHMDIARPPPPKTRKTKQRISLLRQVMHTSRTKSK